MITLKASVLVGLLFGQASFLAVLLGNPAPAPEVRPAETPPPEEDEAQVASAVRQGVEKGRAAIRNTVHNLVPGVKCYQVPLGDSMTVKIIANKDFYKPGRFAVEESPEVAGLVLGMADVYGAFRNVRSKQFGITLWATGTADAIPVLDGIDYSGRPLSCTVHGKRMTLEVGPKTLTNELLACARAAAFGQGLMQTMPVGVDLRGQEFGEKGGQFRSVDVEITFIGLLRYAPDADFCG
jgi:hypothetical protein